MKRLINLGLLLSFQFCYLEWPNNTSFIFQAEYEIFRSKEHWLQNFTHPIILVGLLSQILILISIIYNDFSPKWNLLGVIALSPIVLVFVLVGLLTLNEDIIISTVPYLIFCYLFFKAKIKSLNQ
ncbi:hypothetical protein [Flavobacterium channae]|uniref:hypothetical protein n=1 Tax=Flavobacterium channae TaxID=2897181 RepID=UPI001E2F7AF5|nr:hypothetical protein [Flavobacterium channae]UGS24879.1 hypothetical protein LOS89_06300 [Flavobacterium channae]